MIRKFLVGDKEFLISSRRKNRGYVRAYETEVEIRESGRSGTSQWASVRYEFRTCYSVEGLDRQNRKVGFNSFEEAVNALLSHKEYQYVRP